MHILKDLDYWMNEPYTVQVKKFDDLFYCYIDELRLYASGSTLSKAFQQLEAAKKEHFSLALASGSENELIPPQATRFGSSTIWHDLSIFWIKIASTGLVFGIILAIFLPTVMNALITLPNSIVNTAINKVEAAYATYEGLPEEEKLEKQAALRDLVQDVQPLYDVVSVLWRDTNE